jgi:hypothetical protein
MRVKVLFIDGAVMFGKLVGDEVDCLKANQAIDWIMNNSNGFVRLESYAGQEVQINKDIIKSIIVDDLAD